MLLKFNNVSIGTFCLSFSPHLPGWEALLGIARTFCQSLGKPREIATRYVSMCPIFQDDYFWYGSSITWFMFRINWKIGFEPRDGSPWGPDTENVQFLDERNWTEDTNAITCRYFNVDSPCEHDVIVVVNSKAACVTTCRSLRKSS